MEYKYPIPWQYLFCLLEYPLSSLCTSVLGYQLFMKTHCRVVFMQPSTLHFKVSMYLFYLQMTGVLSLETLQSLVWVQFQSYLIFSLWFSTTAYIHQKEMTVMKLLLEVIRCQGRQMTNHWSPYIAVLHNTAIKLQDTGH